MVDVPMSDDTATAVAALASALDRLTPGNGLRDEITAAISALIDSKLADAVEYFADRVQDATGVRP